LSISSQKIPFPAGQPASDAVGKAASAAPAVAPDAQLSGVLPARPRSLDEDFLMTKFAPLDSAPAIASRQESAVPERLSACNPAFATWTIAN
jgi:hypothetical protein